MCTPKYFMGQYSRLMSRNITMGPMSEPLSTQSEAPMEPAMGYQVRLSMESPRPAKGPISEVLTPVTASLWSSSVLSSRAAQMPRISGIASGCVLKYSR